MRLASRTLLCWTLSCLMFLGTGVAWGQGDSAIAEAEADETKLRAALADLGLQLDSDRARLNAIGGELTIHHHEIEATLEPSTETLSATTVEEVQVTMETKQIRLLLFRDFKVSTVSVTTGGQPISTSFVTEELPSDKLIDRLIEDMAIGTYGLAQLPPPLDMETLRSSGQNAQAIIVQLPSFTTKDQRLDVQVTYSGSYADLDMEPFADEAVFLNGSKLWFPDVIGPTSTFDLDLTIPDDWEAWSQGKWQADQHGDQPTRTVQYRSDVKQGQIVVVAGKYQVERKTIDGIEFASFLFPETAEKVKDQPLMEKSIEYVHFFAERVGPYPYESFAVIETNASVGQGYPGFTLLGGHVINAHFLDPYALGHEILHCWFGNWVIWNQEGGNWSEGITFYLANLLYDEVHKGPEFARQERKRYLEDLSYALRWEDVPTINQFQQTDDIRFSPDAAQNIGYHKLGLLIHGWRTTLGDDAFFAMLRKIVSDFGGKPASLRDLTGVYYDALAAAGKVTMEKDAWLDAYSAAWYDQKGMPFLVLDHVFLNRDEDSGTYDGELVLKTDQFRGFAPPPVQMIIYDGEYESPELIYTDELLDFNAQGTIEHDFAVARPPNWLEIDPGYDQLRWIPDSEKTPCMEFLRKTGPTAIVVTERTMKQVAEAKFNLPALFAGPVAITAMPPAEATIDKIAGSNILAIGTVKDDSWMRDLLTPPLGTTPGGLLTVADVDLFDLGDNDAVFRLVKNEADPITCLGVVYGKDDASVLALLKKLPFYPMESWIALKDNKVVDKGRDSVALRSLRYELWDFEQKDP